MPRLNNNKNARPVRRFVRRPAAALSIALAAALALAACGKKDAAPAGAGGPPPAPQVGVVTVQPGDIGLVTELPGRLEASRIAEVRARAAGILQKRLFAEGSDVKAGQKLFLIDSAPYEAALAQAQASVAQAEASLAQSRALAERYRPLVAVNAISKQEYDNAVAAQKTAEANVAAAKAAVTTARINLGYATVTAPISGRIGRALVTEGALVGQGTPTEMAVIQQIDPLYINFTQSASEALKLRAAMASGKYKKAGANAANVSVVLEDGSVHKQPGRLLFTDLTVDATSGQVTLRAEVPNPDRSLLPGLYVRVRLEQAQVDNGVLLPQQAVTRTGAADTVMVVGEGGRVSPRPVKLGPAQGTNWVVLDGLKAGEQVMVDGFQKLPRVKPGDPMVVQPVPWQANGAAKAPAQAASAAASQPAATPAKQ
ncbi:efflux RND transporter periplasmic adaptor subunit [Alicycliphilus denitrificans]|uniref:Efflux transporter, RND family, MFP subunit n=2 Tax=Alicycliphilus denitrificans TaxID=179636 RepID=F4GG40_ALIDK|nr:efflux RND transporter periplasmic adaptor subunit [Alicycliphilus denitrificans]ADU98226.1 efflux transporter, RND family, MFP subunit [Alicycliphilus denitrificans BC]AEB82824.1 efflux transporter, RND family, MFP subunit [Alicycliphilus denitrificans K601]QKD42507.1 efflux RND transporter periplasmic adaptor subunit [Alicycliphilus denitrificans]GAO26139.1 RND family efflux transporter MFP subunit [Alicycliphilus sp. B1]